MKQDKTDVTILLDRSGSMGNIASDTIGGFNTFLKKNQEASGQCTLSLVQFDSMGIDTVILNKPIFEAKPLTNQTYQPRANTPLYDAIGKTIEATGAFLQSLPEALRPAKVIFVVITDGLENASHHYTLQHVQNQIKHQQDVYKWEFVFLGANIDSQKVAGDVNILRTHTMNYAATSAGVTAAFASTAENTVKYRCGSKADMSYEPEDRAIQKAAGANE
jgi:hypothetical protein